MFNYRLESYRVSKMMYSISSERILALSFIFVLNPDNIEGCISKSRNEEAHIRNELNMFKPRAIPDEALVVTNNIDNLRANKSDINYCMMAAHRSYWDEQLEVTTYYNIANSFHHHYTALHDHHTEQDHNSYAFVKYH